MYLRNNKGSMPRSLQSDDTLFFRRPDGRFVFSTRSSLRSHLSIGRFDECLRESLLDFLSRLINGYNSWRRKITQKNYRPLWNRGGTDVCPGRVGWLAKGSCVTQMTPNERGELEMHLMTSKRTGVGVKNLQPSGLTLHRRRVSDPEVDLRYMITEAWSYRSRGQVINT